MELYQYAFDKARESEQILKNYNKVLYENEGLKKTIKNLESTVEFYKEEVKRMSIGSMSIKKRTQSNIKDNVIDIKRISETESTFKNLFDD